ncbi:MAG: DUF2795 domain-containing protein [Ktedonobacteraceae bacterium]|nr:DUF2795 domain-containing protein [Ktedonobacteraceae bacterium]
MAEINPIQVEKFLKGIDYPANKSILLERAEANGVDENVREALQNLPDQQYKSPTDISKAIGAINKGK